MDRFMVEIGGLIVLFSGFICCFGIFCFRVLPRKMEIKNFNLAMLFIDLGLSMAIAGLFGFVIGAGIFFIGILL